MCGIVGYLGPQSPKQVLLNGLRKLEYRGYDSAGVAIHNGATFEVYRAAGKLSALEEKLKATHFEGSIGIGHTRWATHGLPTEANAHPHKVGGVSLVQNGIIENYGELKKELLAEGVQFSSDTDTEVITHLMARQLEDSPDLIGAIEKVIPRLRGAYAILVVSEKEPETLVAFKAGPPLILGPGEGEIFLASDVQAFIEHTNQVIYLDDFEILKVKGSEFKIFNLQNQAVQKPVKKLDISVAVSNKKGFKHHMLKEVFEQPRAVATALAPHIDLSHKALDFSNLGLGDGEPPSAKALEALYHSQRVDIVACGTSYYAGLYAKYLLEQVAKIQVSVDVASEFRYREPILNKDSLTLFISQSGETADTLAALRLAKGYGLPTMSLCNTKHSTIDREADLHLYMNSGLEVGVASTKSFLGSLSVLSALTIFLAEKRGQISGEEREKLVESLLSLPSLLEMVLSYDSFFDEASKTLKNYRGFLFLGRGHSFPIAMEGALKMKELAYLHAEGYPAGEMKHGPLALIDKDMVIVVICPKDQYYEKTISNLEEAKARGGLIIAIGTGQDEALQSISEHYLSIPPSHWILSGLLSVIPVQLMSYHVADRLGKDVDQPRNLAKSVTVE